MVMMIANDSETKHTHTNKRFKWKGWDRKREKGGGGRVESSENHLTRRKRKRIE
jgi:hypothetical protein